MAPRDRLQELRELPDDDLQKLVKGRDEDGRYTDASYEAEDAVLDIKRCVTWKL